MKIFTLREILILIFMTSILSVVGSLYFSEIVGLVPCTLCWYQRIAIYPIPVLTGVALLREEYNVVYNLRILSLFGLLVAGYQYYIQFFHRTSNFCHVGVSCSDVQFEILGFITLPLLSFLSFLFILILTFMVKKND